MDIVNSLYEHGVIAKYLKIGDILVGEKDRVTIIDIEPILIGNNYDSYNIEVEDCHTFIANGVIVHNMKVITEETF